jgi:alkylation response protein AidB-like acyl-CoA dehydrogenase
MRLVVNRAIQVFRGAGYDAGDEIERLYRAARIFDIREGVG